MLSEALTEAFTAASFDWRYNLSTPRSAMELLEDARQLPQAELEWLAQELTQLSGEDLTGAEHASEPAVLKQLA